MNDAVKKYKIRRQKRLDARGYRKDEDDGEWRTTDAGNKILIEDGVVVGGNLYARASMGKPEGKEIPKKSVKLSKDGTIQHAISGLRGEERKNLAEVIRKGEGKDCIFGGFYKVGTSGGSLKTAEFFNPFTGESFRATVSDSEHTWTDNDPLCSALASIEENDDAKWLYNRSSGVVQKGDKVRVMRGRTLEHGTEANVREIYTSKYGGKEVKYAYLDNGEKINVDNVAIVEDGKLIDRNATVKELKVKGSSGRKKTIRFTEQEREWADGMADFVNGDLRKGDKRGVMAKASQFLRGMTLTVSADGESKDYTIDRPRDFVDELVRLMEDGKKVSISTKW